MKIILCYVFTIDQILYIIVIAVGNGGRGEVVNTPDCGSGIRGFDSHRPPHFN